MISSNRVSLSAFSIFFFFFLIEMARMRVDCRGQNISAEPACRVFTKSSKRSRLLKACAAVRLLKNSSSLVM